MLGCGLSKTSAGQTFYEVPLWFLVLFNETSPALLVN